MASTRYSGVVVCICTSLVSVPVLCAFLNNPLLSQKIPQIAIHYGLLVAAFGLFTHVLRPSGNFWNFETHGSAFYYFCCLFTLLSTLQLTVQGSKFSQIKPKLLDENSLYLKTSQGISSEIAYCLSSYVLCLMMISRMDRYFSSRNLALYWCGATLTNELIFGILMVLNRRYLLEYSTFIHLLYISVALWCLYHFLYSNPRLVPCKTCLTSYWPLADTGLITLLFFSIGFTILRILGAFNVQQSLIRAYASSVEPVILDPSLFAKVWIAITCVVGIPCSVMAISFLNRLICFKNANLALLYAGSMMQGTLVYTLYTIIAAIAEPKYRVSWKVAFVALALNFLFVFSSHLYVLRTIRTGQKPITTICGYAEDEAQADEDECSDNTAND